MKRRNNKVVLTFGTFDIFHPGHIYYLEQAKSYGDYLIVIIARDKTVQKIKGNLPKNEEKIRKDGVVDSGIANEVVLGSLSDPYKWFEIYQPDVLCFGYDQKSFNNEKLIAKLAEIGINPQIQKIGSLRPEIYKSSKL